MASNRTVYHVVPNTSGATSGSSARKIAIAASEEFRTKAEAVDAAKARARKEEPSQVKVHKSDGNMEYESTYGEDPPRTPS